MSFIIFPSARIEGIQSVAAPTTGVAVTVPSVTAGQIDTAFITIEGQNARIRTDGTAASSTSGHLFLTTDTVLVTGVDNVRNISIASVTSTADIFISYGRHL
jgi:hypothetical protein